MQRILREDKLLETADRLGKRIAERFPQSGLSQVAAEVVQITREATVRAAGIRRPNLWLRGGLVVLGLIAVAGITRYILAHDEQTSTLESFLHFLDTTKGMAAYLGALALFLVTLETRLKRWRALQAIHELRAMAHLVDMHQLAKDPELLGAGTGAIVVSGRTMDADSMGRYLHYCTELLALVSKVGQLYVQDFADPPALAAVDQFENLATGLSSKIWQKLMILDRVRTDTGAPTHAPTEAEVPSPPPPAPETAATGH
jgi:hypothetical protein